MANTPCPEVPIAGANEARSRDGTGARNRRRTDGAPKRGWRPALTIALSIALIDWSTKAAVAARIPLGDHVVVLDGGVALWHVRNPALILGLFGDLPLANRMWIAALLALAGVVLIAEILSRAQRLLPHRQRWAWAFVGLMCGGMLGNLGERALHWWVTDFLSIRWGSIWLPPGNVADLAIVLSIPVSLLVIAFEVEARGLRGSTPDLSGEASGGSLRSDHV